MGSDTSGWGTVGTLTAPDCLMWEQTWGETTRRLMDGDGWRRTHDRAGSVAMGTSTRRRSICPFLKMLLQFHAFTGKWIHLLYILLWHPSRSCLVAPCMTTFSLYVSYVKVVFQLRMLCGSLILLVWVTCFVQTYFSLMLWLALETTLLKQTVTIATWPKSLISLRKLVI